MPVAAVKTFSIKTLKGGRNGIDPPTLIPEDQCIEALNVDWFVGALGRKRPGCDNISLTGGTPPEGSIAALFRHLPAGSNENMAQMWLVDGSSIVHYLNASATWADVTLKDVITGGHPELVRAVSFNGKLFLLYQNTAGRVNVYDNTAGAITRRVGLAAPTSAPSGVVSAGAVTDTRTYQSAVVVKSGGVVIRRSELSPASSAIVMSAQQETLTLTGAPGEGETDWEAYAASTDGVYKLVSSATIGNTIIDNNASLTGTLAPVIGTNSLFPDAVLGAVDGSRLILGRHRTNTAQTSRLYFTVPFATAGDDERVPTILTQNYYLDLSPNDGDFITAIQGPVFGSMHVFKNHQIWKLTPTGDATAPYSTTLISKTIGSIFDKATVLGTDEHGQACIYFISMEGPYRYGAQGLQYMGRDVEDIWPSINLSASVPAHGVYFSRKHQVWWWVCTGTNTTPDTMLVYDTILGHALLYPVGDSPPTAGVRRGYAKWTGDLAHCQCSVMFGNTLGTTMGITQVPYAGFTTSPKLLRGDSATATDDAGTKFQSFLKTKAYQPAGTINFFEVGQPLMQCKASSGTTIELQMIPDWGAQPTVRDYITLTATDTETRVWRKFEKAQQGRSRTIQFQIGDPVAQSVSWELDEYVQPVTPLEPMT